jgi:hypothetical protein
MRGNVPINLRDACTEGRELLVAREGRLPLWVLCENLVDAMILLLNRRGK